MTDDRRLSPDSGPVDRRRTSCHWLLILVSVLLLLASVPIVLKRLGSFGWESRGTPSDTSDEPFDLTRLTIPKSKLVESGVGRDGISALSLPEFTVPDDATALHCEDRVAGVVLDGEARAYSLRILEIHEVVNDQIGSHALAVTYCPLCDSVAVFDRQTSTGLLEFGVSGYLYNSNVVMYDRTTESLWSQISGRRLSGNSADRELSLLPVEVTTWCDWKERYPSTRVLSFANDRGHSYTFSPYGRYFADGQLTYSVDAQSDRFPPMTPVLGVRAASGTRAYVIPTFSAHSEPIQFTDLLGRITLKLRYEPRSHSLRVIESSEAVEVVYAFWFAWYAFHPETDVYDADAAHRARLPQGK